MVHQVPRWVTNKKRTIRQRLHQANPINSVNGETWFVFIHNIKFNDTVYIKGIEPIQVIPIHGDSVIGWRQQWSEHDVSGYPYQSSTRTKYYIVILCIEIGMPELLCGRILLLTWNAQMSEVFIHLRKNTILLNNRSCHTLLFIRHGHPFLGFNCKSVIGIPLSQWRSNQFHQHSKLFCGRAKKKSFNLFSFSKSGNKCLKFPNSGLILALLNFHAPVFIVDAYTCAASVTTT